MSAQTNLLLPESLKLAKKLLAESSALGFAGKLHDNSLSPKIYRVTEIIDSPHAQITSPKSQILYKLKIEPWMFNFGGSVHGGVIATIMDELTSLTIWANDRNRRMQVSVDLNVTYIDAIDTRYEYIYVLTQVDKVGRNLCYTQVWFLNEQKKLLALGRHTKAIVSKSISEFAKIAPKL